MTAQNPFDRTVEVIRATFKDPTVRVTPDTTADDVPGWDSLSHAVFLMNIERAFGIRFDPREVLELENVGALVELIGAKLT